MFSRQYWISEIKYRNKLEIKYATNGIEKTGNFVTGGERKQVKFSLHTIPDRFNGYVCDTNIFYKSNWM